MCSVSLFESDGQRALGVFLCAVHVIRENMQYSLLPYTEEMERKVVVGSRGILIRTRTTITMAKEEAKNYSRQIILRKQSTFLQQTPVHAGGSGQCLCCVSLWPTDPSVTLDRLTQLTAS